MLHEVSFPSYNGRDQVQGWIYVPAAKPKGIVQIIHGFGEHSRRYLHMIASFVEAGYIVAADDHVGHGKTAMMNDTWGDWGEAGPHTMTEDEHRLKELVCEKGRAEAIGRPILYGTTDTFLKNFGFSSIKDLPEIDDIESAMSGSFADDVEDERDELNENQMRIEI